MKLKGTQLLALWGVTGFALSLVAHLLTFTDIALQQSVPAIWGLHVGIFPPFFALVIYLQRWTRGSWPRRHLQWKSLLPYLPHWVRISGVVLFAYTFFNFFNATRFLPAKGDPPPATAAAEHQKEVYTLRAFSGHWMLFYALPAAFFLFVPAGARPEPEAGEAQADGEAALLAGGAPFRRCPACGYRSPAASHACTACGRSLYGTMPARALSEGEGEGQEGG
jgi:hypothetical protein